MLQMPSPDKQNVHTKQDNVDTRSLQTLYIHAQSDHKSQTPAGVQPIQAIKPPHGKPTMNTHIFTSVFHHTAMLPIIFFMLGMMFIISLVH